MFVIEFLMMQWLRQSELIGVLMLELAMSDAKIKTIPKALDDELKDLDIDLMDARPVVLCPYCFEMHGEDVPAVQSQFVKHHYNCGHCGLGVSLQ